MNNLLFPLPVDVRSITFLFECCSLRLFVLSWLCLFNYFLCLSVFYFVFSFLLDVFDCFWVFSFEPFFTKNVDNMSISFQLLSEMYLSFRSELSCFFSKSA